MGSFVKKIMAIPFLPADLTIPTYSLLQIPALQHSQTTKIETFLAYYKKQWLTKISPEELSIFSLENVTNNVAESYHGKLKTIIKSSHPRIWNIMTAINDIIADYDNEMARLQLGREITRSSKRKHVITNERRKQSKEKLLNGSYTSVQFLESISSFLGILTLSEETTFRLILMYMGNQIMLITEDQINA